jgi:formylglycine-generating enzyme required for sulfatase activity
MAFDRLSNAGEINLGKKIVSVLIIFCLFPLIAGRVQGQEGGRTYTGPAKRKSAPAKPPPKRAKSLPEKQEKEEPPEIEEVVKPIPPDVIPQLVRIPAGSFAMGSEAKRPNEKPIHNVEMESFEIGIYEITNREFEAFVKAIDYKTDAERQNEPITWRDYYQPGRETYPVVLVSWNDTAMYCKWLSEGTGETFRLPTEAEWEYAARGGLAGKNYPWGDEIDKDRANYDDNDSSIIFTGVALNFIQPVNSYSPNGYGLFNISGNVWEWCNDWYDENYYRNSSARNPKGPENGSFKIIRGGGWINDMNSCRVSFRNFNSTNFVMPYIGFRVVKEIRDQESGVKNQGSETGN